MSDDLIARLRSPEKIVFPAGTEIAVCGGTIRTLEPFSMWSSSSDRQEAAAEIERLRARVAVLEGLLAPLSAEADKHDPPDGDDDHLAWGSVLTIGHLREARAALEAKP